MGEFLSEREAEIFYAEQRGYASAMEAERKLHEARIEELEAKLAKAVAALYAISGDVPYADDPYDIARITLAELKGEK